MKLTAQEKKDILRDGRSRKRRDHFRLGRHPRGPVTFEAYLAALDDLQQAFPPRPAKPFVRYTNIQL